MNRQEFIQEAALRLIAARPDALMCEIHELAVSLANCVYADSVEEPSEPVRPSPTATDFRDDNVQVLLDVINSTEDQAKSDFEAAHPSWYYQRRGYAITLRHAFDINGVATVGDLLSRGRVGCLKLPKVGRKSVEALDLALKELYGITAW